MSQKYIIVQDNKIVTSSKALERAKEYAALAAQDAGDGAQAHIYSFVTTAVNHAITFCTTPPSGKLNGAKKKDGRGGARTIVLWTEAEDKSLGHCARELSKQFPKISHRLIAEQLKARGLFSGRSESSLRNRLSRIRGRED